MVQTQAEGRAALAAGRFVLRLAGDADREAIYRSRHEVYARELGQHATREDGRLVDALDDANLYIVAAGADGLLGYVSITPPDAPSYSVDKYFAREDLPFAADEALYEVRLLTVLAPRRGRSLAMALAYAALRWVQHHGGTRVVAIGRRNIMDFYRRLGMRAVGLSTRSGAVTFDLMHASTAELGRRCDEHRGAIARALRTATWELDLPRERAVACFHGGAFFDAVGARFDDLDRRHDVINADVLDAWYPPAPGVVEALTTSLPWLLRTSPPTGCEGLLDAIAAARGVPARCLLPGAGSSDLIFRALPRWLDADSRVLLLDPTYGEYAHVLERVLGARVDRFPLDAADGFEVDVQRLHRALAAGYDLAVVVNPNSPTGRHVLRGRLLEVIDTAPPRTRWWIDETYVDHAGPDATLEARAAAGERVVVCKSMSKVYALSGARAAYLCGPPALLEPLREWTPPWVVSLPAQVAAVRALEDPAYYAGRIAETAALRAALVRGLEALGWRTVPAVANFVLCLLPPEGPTAAAVVEACRARGLFLRDAALMGRRMGTHALRTAVKDAATQQRMLDILREVVDAA